MIDSILKPVSSFSVFSVISIIRSRCRPVGILLTVMLALTLISPNAIAQQCETSNDALEAMGKAEVVFSNREGQQQTFQVKLADNFITRAAGFQRVCAATIAAEPILFVFDSERRPNFHMRNVVAPIDIAFIDKQGGIDSILAMQPYVLGSTHRPLYAPKEKVVAALEVHPGFYQQHNIDTSTIVTWRKVE